ncbi:MAG: anthranilate phosphoribosyltransferase [Phycisphaerales bacterium]
MNRLLDQILAGRSMTIDEAEGLVVELSQGEAPAALVAGVLVALRSKGETPDEVAGFARGMLSRARRPALGEVRDACDIVGTGGDSSHSLNISTGSAILAASAGLRVIKHGNRSITSRSGSADVLAELGLLMPIDEATAAECLRQTGFTFLFAPHYHPAAAAVAPVRKALGVRTVFNMLGPMTNPARPGFGLIGAYSLPAAELMAHAMSRMDVRRAFVVHSDNGWDEPTTMCPFHLFDVREGRASARRIDPRELGLSRGSERDLAGGDAAHNARELRRALTPGEHAAGSHRDALVLNSALALEVSSIVASTQEGIDRARAAIDSGAAEALLKSLGDFGAKCRERAHG